mgnify:CR=1 FL=1
MKPLLKWSCLPLSDGWVMFGVDVDLAGPDEPECLMGLRRAVHPYWFENEDPGLPLSEVIADMTYRIMRGVGEGAKLDCASRAHAFGC